MTCCQDHDLCAIPAGEECPNESDDDPETPPPAPAQDASPAP